MCANLIRQTIDLINAIILLTTMAEKREKRETGLDLLKEPNFWILDRDRPIRFCHSGCVHSTSEWIVADSNQTVPI